MRSVHARLLSHFAIGVSTAALMLPAAAAAQDAAATVGQTGPAQTDPQPATADGTAGQADGDIVVTGIRASLRDSVNIKRNAQGIVDAISAEDMGKFPDTNLAESLQRITGVSIDRSNGEGQFVTVRGFGADYNLVTLNGRQMPTSFIGDGNSAPGSRAFDFATLASEGVAALEVYKSGRASIPTGGIGATVNVRTPRPLDKPGLRGSIAARGVVDTSQNGRKDVTPEISGIISDTFADDRIGILINGTYQRRNFSSNTANIGWRDGYLGNENNWGSLAMPGDPRYANITNRPKATDVYQVPQNGGYDVVNGRRERINGQAVLQFRPTDDLTATIDYTYARNTIDIRDNSVGIWYNHNDTLSAWTNGPVAGPIFYTERFGAGETKDLAYSASQTSVRNENKSLGGNLTWNAPGGVTMTLDAHHSTAESKPNSPYGNSNSVGTAVFGVQNQTLNFDHELPVISYNMYSGIDPLNAANIVPTGNAFRNSYFRDEINQVMVRGHYDHGHGFMDSLDWGTEYTDNKVRSAYSVLQNDTWGGTGGDSPAQRAAAAALLPDNLFNLTSIPDKFSGISGANDPNIIKSFYSFDLPSVVKLLDQAYKICGGNGQCLIPYNTDSRVHEKTMSAYAQFNGKFDLFSRTAHLIAGLRYEHTDVSASALVPTPVGARQNSQNEFNVLFQGSGFTTFKGSYENWLPSVDFDFQPLENVKLRASYSHTIARADYGSLQGGRRIDQLFRVGGGTGAVGNPNLVPYKSKNIDLSAEWYYGPESYISVGYFNKDVKNFIGTNQVNTPAFDLRNPGSGPRYRQAVAALGTTDNLRVRDYILRNFPASSQVTGTSDSGLLNGNIFGLPEDDLFNFQLSQPFNSDQTANINGWEFAIQHRLWETGFGVILNYTIVNGDAKYDNTIDPNIGQFALTGLSDSANAVAYYDKNGIQARVAYNWRGEFYAGGAFDPTYVEAYGQVDASASAEVKKGLAVFVEAINLTGQGRRGHRRSDNFVTFAQPGYARYSAGMRFTF